MKTIFMSATMRDKVSAMYEDEVTEACYRHYDSELRRENLTQPEIRAFFEAELQARPYLEGSAATYNYDDKGVTTTIVSKSRPIYGNKLREDGFIIIRNLTGTYDIHEFWGETKNKRGLQATINSIFGVRNK